MVCLGLVEIVGILTYLLTTLLTEGKKEQLLLSVLIKYLTFFFMLKRQWHYKIYGCLPLKNQKLRALTAEVISTCERKFTTLLAL